MDSPAIEEAKIVVAEQPLEERPRQDDLGALAEDFNRMAASLQKSHAELEQKVDERTRKLQATLEQLAAKSRELEDASKHKSEFLANMSHELRTPLNAIIGFSQVLQQKLFGEVNDKQDEYLEDILSSADHLLALINDILDLSKVEAGQVELETGLFSLREALEGGVVMVRERAIKNGVALELELDPAVDLVEGDERRIRQVVFNLLSNAVKFTPAGGRVDVSAARRRRRGPVAVADTGPGIAAEDRARIFEEFQQAKATKASAARAPASASPCPGAWSSCTAAASGSSPSRARARPSPSPCRWRRTREGARPPLAELADGQVRGRVRAARGRAGGGNGRLSPPLVLRDEQDVDSALPAGESEVAHRDRRAHVATHRRPVGRDSCGGPVPLAGGSHCCTRSS